MTVTCNDLHVAADPGLSPEAGSGHAAGPADRAGWSGRRPFGARFAIAWIQLYQLARTGRTSPCRFIPTCSQYAVLAVERHGLRRGLRLTLGRLGRCRPGGPFGSDPVPE